MKRFFYVYLLAQLLLPYTSLAVDRSTLHHQRTEVLREKKIVPRKIFPKPVVKPPASPKIESDLTYTSMLIRSRAKHRPVAHNGLVVHNAVEIRKYDPEKHAGLSGGNVIASPEVKYLYNVTIVKDLNVRIAGGTSIELGNIHHEGDAKELVNLVDVRGKIAASRIRIGNVTNIGEVRRIINSLSIGGKP